MELDNMEWIILLLLIALLFKDEIKELKAALLSKEQTAEETKNKRKEEFETELNNIMDYSIDKAIESKVKRGEADE
jgi:hypothetical protein